jgi:hypothetical protein
VIKRDQWLTKAKDIIAVYQTRAMSTLPQGPGSPHVGPTVQPYKY